MGQLITANVATNLYWLGRHLERLELTLLEINKAYDKVIDVDQKAGSKLYKKFGVKLKYASAMDFLSQAIRGDHEANLTHLMVNARENAIISRSYVDAWAFGEIIELHALLQKMSKNTFEIDHKDIDTALSLTSEIWGAYEKKGHRKYSDYFLKLGKLIEEVDFRLRFNKSQDITDLILEDIDTMFKLLDQESDELPKKSQKEEKESTIMDELNEKVDTLIIF